MVNSKLPIVAFVPCRRGSERVKHKNIRTFAGIENGLISIKIEQLIQCPEIDSIVVSTDDPIVSEICHAVAAKQTKPIKICDRPAYLASSTTSTDELIEYVPEIIDRGIVLWTHVTSPFVDADVYSQAIQVYREKTRSEHRDSLMSVTKIQKFLWNQSGPINYDRLQEKWPRTQTLPVLYEINSAIFLSPIETYINLKDRVGKNVHLFELTALQAMDIDWEEDFRLAEECWHHEQQKYQWV
ncbi:MAG: acylneuraminate cytidylyltransferase family protein [Pleurocapsa sp.]